MISMEQEGYEGVSACIDINATNAVFRTAKRAKSDDEATSLSMLCKPCIDDNKDKRIIQTIIAGSIRPNNRSVHIGHADNGK